MAPGQVTFVQSVLSPIPPAQTLSVTSTEGVLQVSVSSSGASWLAVQVFSVNTPLIVNVWANPTGLTPGAYSAEITITAAGAANSPLTVPVTMYVTAAQAPSVSTAQMAFQHELGTPVPQPQTLLIYGPAGSISVTATADVGAWLAVTPTSTTAPTSLTVLVNPIGLAPGTYRGFITVFSNATTPVVSQVVSVTLYVSGGGLWVSNSSLLFSYHIGGPAPKEQSIQVSHYIWSAFSVSVNSGGWLHVDPPEGIAPADVTVSVDPAGLAAGTYHGALVFYSTFVSYQVTVPVTLTVTGGPPLSASPAILGFEAPAGGVAPPTKSVSLNSSPSAAFNTHVAVGGSWLSVSPATGVTPATLTIGVNQAGLAPGTYTGSIVITVPGANVGGQLVTVRLTVTGGAPLTAAPTTLRFDAASAATTPSPQTVTVSAPWPTAVAVAVSGGWLQVTPSSATTPAVLNVSVNPAGMATGMHNGTITITSPGAPVAPATVNVALNVAGASPVIREVSNGAGLGHDFAPGSTITIYGADLGPAQPQTARTLPGQPITGSLAGTRLLVNGIEAALLYVQARQLNAVLPFALAGQRQIEIQVDCFGMLSEKMVFPLADTAPVLLTADASGRGQAAALNENGLLNGPLNPADRGSVIVAFGAGGGPTEASDGAAVLEIGPSRLRSPVTVWIGSIQAEVIYAGQAPGMATGMLQFNVRVPEEAGSGNLALTVRIGEAFSQPGVTVAVR